MCLVSGHVLSLKKYIQITNSWFSQPHPFYHVSMYTCTCSAVNIAGNVQHNVNGDPNRQQRIHTIIESVL